VNFSEHEQDSEEWKREMRRKCGIAVELHDPRARVRVHAGIDSAVRVRRFSRVFTLRENFAYHIPA